MFLGTLIASAEPFTVILFVIEKGLEALVCEDGDCGFLAFLKRAASIGLTGEFFVRKSYRFVV